jgi:hypothetical protein
VKGILIDPWAKSVEQIQSADDFGLAELHELVKAETLDFARPFEDRTEFVVVADDGALRELPFFKVDGYHWPLHGRAVILGTSRGGDTRDTKLSVEWVHQMIEFP